MHEPKASALHYPIASVHIKPCKALMCYYCPSCELHITN